MLIGQAQANGSYSGWGCVELLSQNHITQSLIMESSDFRNLGWVEFLSANGTALISGVFEAGKQTREKTGFAFRGMRNSLEGLGYLFLRLLSPYFSSVGPGYFGNHLGRRLSPRKLFDEVLDRRTSFLHPDFLRDTIFKITFRGMVSSSEARPGYFGDIKFGLEGIQVMLLALQQRINLAILKNTKLKSVLSIQIPRSLKVDAGMFAVSQHGKMVDLALRKAASRTNVPFSIGFAENFVDPANSLLGWIRARITHAWAVPFSLRAVGCFRTVNGNLISNLIIPNFDVRNLRRNWLPAAENEGDGPSSSRSLQGTL